MTLEEYLSTREQSSVSKELLEKLKNVTADENYYISVLNRLKTDEERSQLIDFIDKSESATYENVILYSLRIAMIRNGEWDLQNDKPKSN